MPLDLDKQFKVIEPADFLKQHAKAVSQDGNQFASDVYGLKDFWGVEREELDWWAAYAVESRLCRPFRAPLRKFEGNIWDSLIAHPWGNYHEEIGAIFMGAVPIGAWNDAENFYYSFFQQQRGEKYPNIVYSWTHESYWIDEVVDKSLDEFAYRIAVGAAFDRKSISPDVARECLSKLGDADAAEFDACMDEGNDDEDDEDDYYVEEFESCNACSRRMIFRGDLDEDFSARMWYFRAQWIMSLLFPADPDWDEDPPCSFRKGYNGLYDEAEFEKRMEAGKTAAPVAVYLLWRYFWFNRQSRMNTLMEAYKNHPAKVVRDLIQLLQQINSGRREIGAIKDIIARREEFLANDFTKPYQEE